LPNSTAQIPAVSSTLVASSRAENATTPDAASSSFAAGVSSLAYIARSSYCSSATSAACASCLNIA